MAVRENRESKRCKPKSSTLLNGELRSDEAVPYLVKALQDEVPQVTNAAERGLQKLGIAKRRGTGFEEQADDTR